MFRWIILIACLLAAAAGLAVGVMNPEPVDISLPGIDLKLALGSLIVVVFVAGLLTGLLLFLVLFHLPSRFARKSARSTAANSRLSDRHA